MIQPSRDRPALKPRALPAIIPPSTSVQRRTCLPLGCMIDLESRWRAVITITKMTIVREPMLQRGTDARSRDLGARQVALDRAVCCRVPLLSWERVTSCSSSARIESFCRPEKFCRWQRATALIAGGYLRAVHDTSGGRGAHRVRRSRKTKLRADAHLFCSGDNVLTANSVGSGGETRHQHYNELGAGKLDSVYFQSIPTDEAKRAGYFL